METMRIQRKFGRAGGSDSSRRTKDEGIFDNTCCFLVTVTAKDPMAKHLLRSGERRPG